MAVVLVHNYYFCSDFAGDYRFMAFKYEICTQFHALTELEIKLLVVKFVLISCGCDWWDMLIQS